MRLRLCRSYAHVWRLQRRVLVRVFSAMAVLAVLFALLLVVRSLVVPLWP